MRWEGCHLLEIGCGQDLAYSYAFARHNKVTAIDLELPLRPPYIRNLLALLSASGAYRACKSVIAKIAGKRKYFERALSEITGFRGPYDVTLCRMNACNLSFPEKSFDGVFSFSVFEHIDNPFKALCEVRRVLKPGGVLYLDLHLFTAVHGDHDFRPGVPPWNHLRCGTAPKRPPCFVNRVRLAKWRDMVSETFPSVWFLNIDGEMESTRHHLTNEIRQELADYSEEELLTTTFIAVARKN
jgi:SAM-dependent methyltransferase